MQFWLEDGTFKAKGLTSRKEELAYKYLDDHYQKQVDKKTPQVEEAAVENKVEG